MIVLVVWLFWVWVFVWSLWYSLKGYKQWCSNQYSDPLRIHSPEEVNYNERKKCQVIRLLLNYIHIYRHSMLGFFQDIHVRVSIFLNEGIQHNNGRSDVNKTNVPRQIATNHNKLCNLKWQFFDNFFLQAIRTCFPEPINIFH